VKKLLDDKGFEIDRRRIDLKDPIKEIGEFDVSIRVGQDVTARVKVVVKPLGGQLEDKAVEAEVASAASAAADVAAEPAEPVQPTEESPEA
jgi:large subunit ribosomal protein L9